MKKKYHGIAHMVFALAAYGLGVTNSEVALAANAVNGGKVKFFANANADFSNYINNPSAAQKKWMGTHYDRMLVYPPSFDSKNAWYKGGMAYVNSYAIYANEALAKSHPQWIMHDAQGNKLYIPWDCNNGQCSQYAGDFSNPDFRRYMVQKMKAIAKKGYRGLWLDDVNLTWRVGNDNNQEVHITPIDSRTHKPMTLANWRRYFVQYLQEIRAALPKNVEIAHNAIWYADSIKKENQNLTRQIKAANYINLERAGNDNGLVGGTSEWGYETFLKYVDYVHRHGAGVMFMDTGSSLTEHEFGLATWFLISQGKDLINSNRNEGGRPDNWWKGFGLNLGKALNDRYKWRGVIRRDFACGSVLLNQPDAPTVSVNVGSGYKNLDARQISSFNLSARTAAILTTACNSARPVPSHKFLPR